MENKTLLAGTVVKTFTFDHETHGKKFYRGAISVKRASGVEDIIQVVVSEHLIDTYLDYSGKFVSASGEFRSRNVCIGGKRRLDLFLFVNQIEIASIQIDLNIISLQGFICKQPVYRITPCGKEICDLFVAVKGSCGRDYYIPCIAWKENAVKANGFKLGDKVRLSGRIQSREYQKKIGEEEYEKRITYEVSVSKVEVMESEV